MSHHITCPTAASSFPPLASASHARILLDEGKPQFAAQDEDRNQDAFVLHVMNADGSDIHQISFNQSNDMDPSVLANGQVVFTRWDHAPNNDAMNLYRVNPDGTGLELLYGKQSHQLVNTTGPVQFLQARQLVNGRVMSLIRPFSGTLFGGDIISIDTTNYVENTQPTLPNVGVLSGPAQEPATVNEVQTDPTRPSEGGLFSSVYPLTDGTNRMLVSWSLCRVLENNVIVPCTPDRLANPATLPAPPLYGIWIYDQDRDTQIPVVPPEEGVIINDVVTMQARTLPPVILDKVSGVDLDSTLVSEGVGILHIRSVYDIDGVDTAPGGITTLRNPGVTTADQRPARFLRIEKAVSMPDDDVLDFRNTAFGTVNFMREILGYVPVQPDGSVRVKVPANVALDISILDLNGRRIGPRHNNWLQVRPGEVLECNGCHDPTEHQLAWAREPVRLRQSRRADNRSALPEHRADTVRRHGRNHGADPVAQQLRDRQLSCALAECRCDLRRRVDRPDGSAQGCKFPLSLW